MYKSRACSSLREVGDRQLKRLFMETARRKIQLRKTYLLHRNRGQNLLNQLQLLKNQLKKYRRMAMRNQTGMLAVMKIMLMRKYKEKQSKTHGMLQVMMKGNHASLNNFSVKSFLIYDQQSPLNPSQRAISPLHQRPHLPQRQGQHRNQHRN